MHFFFIHGADKAALEVTYFNFFPSLPDTLVLRRVGHEENIALLKKGIAWWTDKNVKFRNPVGETDNLKALFQGKTTSD